MLNDTDIQPAAPATPKRKFKRFHQVTCGGARLEYDDFADVREACERKLKEWEREGIVVPWEPFRGNDWLFG